MIDLEKFTGKDDKREWLNQPFNIGDETIATNGHIIIAVPKREGYVELARAKQLSVQLGVQRVLDSIPEVLSDPPEPRNERRIPGMDCFDFRDIMDCFDFGDMVIDKTYYNLIIDLPGLKVAIAPTACYFTADGCRGVVMGVMV